MTDEMRFDRRMSDADALMWAIEKDPLLRSTITAVAVLDHAPDHDRLLDKVERATRLIPRLRQRVLASPLVPAPPRWVVDPNFDLRYHLRWLRAPRPGTLRTLLDVAAPIAMQGFDRARPLWEFTVVEDLADGKAALIQKVHHSITDGVGGMKLAMMILDLEAEPVGVAEPMPAAPEPEHLSSVARLADAAAHERRRQLGIAARALGSVGRGATSPPSASPRSSQGCSTACRRRWSPRSSARC